MSLRLILLVAFILLATALAAEVPNLVSYQGRLTDGDGNPVPDGSYNVTFYIWEHQNPVMGEQPIWTSGLRSVTVTDGLFSYVLGSNIPLPTAVFADDGWAGHYLRVGVEGSMLTAVEQLVAVPFAYKAIMADTAEYALSGSGGGGANGWVDDGAVVRLESGGDRVGIGTSTASEPLVVGDDLGSYEGDYIVSGNSDFEGFSGFILGRNPDNRAMLQWYGDGLSAQFHVRSSGQNYNNVLTVGRGKVGVNTDGGTAALNVNGSAQIDDTLRVMNRVGIMNTNPSEPLVVGDDLGSFYGDRIVIGDNTAGAQTGLVIGENSNSRGWLLWDINGNYLSVGVRDVGTSHNNVLVVRDGKVGIGTTNPFGPLHVVGRAICDELQLLGGADLAEPFEMTGGTIPAGALVVIDDLNPGKLKLSDRAYDTRVAGVVSGAGGVKPGLTLSQKDVFESGRNVAMNGRVYCLADASYGPIAPGDLLTTSDTPGHAMRAADRARAYGSVIGKAMSQLDDGTGLVLVLVNLH